MANSLTVTDTHMISVFEQEALGGNTSNFFTSAGLTFSTAFFWQKQRSAFPSPHPAETFFFFLQHFYLYIGGVDKHILRMLIKTSLPSQSIAVSAKMIKGSTVRVAAFIVKLGWYCGRQGEVMGVKYSKRSGEEGYIWLSLFHLTRDYIFICSIPSSWENPVRRKQQIWNNQKILLLHYCYSTWQKYIQDLFVTYTIICSI